MSKWSPIAVAGAGIISAIGNNTGECLSALANGQAGMDEIAWLDTALRHKLPVAEVKCSNVRLAELAGVASTAISRTALLSLIAAREALERAAIPNFAALRTGFVSANTVGGMDRTEKFFVNALTASQAAGVAPSLSKGKLREVVQHECGYSTE